MIPPSAVATLGFDEDHKASDVTSSYGKPIRVAVHRVYADSRRHFKTNVPGW
jgi:hypothetical protein